MDKWIAGEGVLIRYNGSYMEQLRVQKVIRVGSSNAVVLPAAICRAMKIERGDQVAFGVYEHNTIQIRKLSNDELRAMRPPQNNYEQPDIT